jgi:hypothetical protein
MKKKREKLSKGRNNKHKTTTRAIAKEWTEIGSYVNDWISFSVPTGNVVDCEKYKLIHHDCPRVMCVDRRPFQVRHTTSYLKAKEE